MKQLCAAFSLVLFVTAAAAPAVAAPADDPGLRAALSARYAAAKAATDRHDAKGLAAIFAPDAVFVDTNCKTATADVVANALVTEPADPHRQSNTTIVSVKRNGNAVIVEQKRDTSTVRPGPGGKMQKPALHTESTDTWVFVKGTWLLKRSVGHLVDFSMNGVTRLHRVAQKACN